MALTYESTNKTLVRAITAVPFFTEKRLGKECFVYDVFFALFRSVYQIEAETMQNQVNSFCSDLLVDCLSRDLVAAIRRKSHFNTLRVEQSPLPSLAHAPRDRIAGNELNIAIAGDRLR
jgi:hypothetical protein